MFEDKLATTEFQYDGIKNGAAWKTKVERYMVYKAPVLKELLEWAEAQEDGTVTTALHAHRRARVCATSARHHASSPRASTVGDEDNDYDGRTGVTLFTKTRDPYISGFRHDYDDDVRAPGRFDSTS